MLDTGCQLRQASSMLDFRDVEPGRIQIHPKAGIERDALIPASLRGGFRAPRVLPKNMPNNSA